MSDNNSQKKPRKDPLRIIMFALLILGYLSPFFFGSISAANDSMIANPKTLIAIAIVSLALLFFPRGEKAIREGIYPGLFKRYFTAYLDLTIAMYLAFSLLFPILLLTENTARKDWVWSWETAISPAYVPVSIVSILLCFVGIYFYFRMHLERGRATPGQYMMGYKIIPTGVPNYNRRIWVSARYLLLWFLAWTTDTETEDVYIWDKSSNSQAVCVE